MHFALYPYILCCISVIFDQSTGLFDSGRKAIFVRRRRNHRYNNNGSITTRTSTTTATTTVTSLRAGSSLDDDTNNDNKPMIALDYNGQQRPPQKAFILMDGFCPYHGGYIASRIKEIPGVAIVYVLSNYMKGYLLSKLKEEEQIDMIDDDNNNKKKYNDLDVMKIPETKEDVERWKKYIRDDVELVAVYCESDSGLADAERLRDLLKVTCQDDPPILEARRNKHLMQQIAMNSNNILNAAKQKLCTTKEEATEFANELLNEESDDHNNTKTKQRVVVKPIRGVASESVYLCTTIEDVQDAWDAITSTQIFGSNRMHDTVLVQEFIDGTEYAIDVVSRNGQHKVAAIWRYDKRPVNNASFCYFKTELVDIDIDDEDALREVQTVCENAIVALNELGVKWGISHNEFIYSSKNNKAYLIEVNCRQHNMDFSPLTMACIGYNALDMMLVSIFGDDDDWDMYPTIPTLRAYGCMVHLVCYVNGILKQTNHIEEIATTLSSVFDCEVYEQYITPGCIIEPTIDIRTDAGWVQLINDDPITLQQDYEQIVKWMPTMFDVIEKDDI